MCVSPVHGQSFNSIYVNLYIEVYKLALTRNSKAHTTVNIPISIKIPKCCVKSNGKKKRRQTLIQSATVPITAICIEFSAALFVLGVLVFPLD